MNQNENCSLAVIGHVAPGVETPNQSAFFDTDNKSRWSGKSRFRSRSSFQNSEDLAFLRRSFPELSDFKFCGSGGFGVVYSARQDHMGRRVAIKVLDVSLVSDGPLSQQFYSESRLQASITHPSIVTLFDAGVRESRPYIIMEHVPQGTLRQRMQVSNLGSREALNILRQICLALEVAHARNLVHRDIKPENILMDADGTPKLGDFGLARVVDTVGRGYGSYDYPAGTVRYMAPEVLDDPTVIDPRSDLYSAILVFYESVIGVLPGNCTESVSAQSRMVTPLRKKLDALVLRGLHSNPKLRFQSAYELRSAIDEILSDQRVQVSVSRRSRRKFEGIFKYFLVVAMFVLFLESCIATFYWVRLAKRFDRVKYVNQKLVEDLEQRDQGLETLNAQVVRLQKIDEERSMLVDPNDVNSIVQLSDDGICLHPDAGTKNLSTEERRSVNQILSDLHQEYLKIEIAHTTQVIAEDGGVVSTIRMDEQDLGPLVDELWSRVDSVVSGLNQRFLRETIPLFNDPNTLVTERPGLRDSKAPDTGKIITTDPRMTLNLQTSRVYRRLYSTKLRYPQLFGWKADQLPIRITVKRRGVWYSWTIEQLMRSQVGNRISEQTGARFVIADSGESQRLPFGLQRFWFESTTLNEETPIDSDPQSVPPATASLKSGLSK